MRIAHFVIALGVALACASPTFAKTAKECNAEYAANKAAIQAAEEKRADFITACKAGTEVIPTATAAPSSTAPTAPGPTTTAAKPAAPVSASEAEAAVKCPTDTVVWVNSKSGVYHFKGTHNYGTTKAGTYMCEADAKSAGDRAAKNEKHP